MRNDLVTRLCLCILAVLILQSSAVFADPGKKLLIGVYEKPPYAMKNEEGQWSGIAVELWEQIALKLKWNYEYREMPYETLISELTAGKLDFVVAGIPVEPELEKKIDFSQPFMPSSLGIAVSSMGWKANWFQIFRDFFDWGFVQIILCIFGGILAVSFLIWLVERKHENNHFGGNSLHGLGSAIWFSAVTMTTVGYGDKTPQTIVGRTIAFLWMMIGVLIIAAFTATVTAAHLKSGNISNLSDIRHMHNGVVTDSDAEFVLKNRGISRTSYKTSEEALQALADRKLQTVVGDRIDLAYLTNHDYSDSLKMLAIHFDPYQVAFAMPEQSPFRNALNIVLLEVIKTEQWKNHLITTLGADF